ncbi:MAG: hypothetical protein LBU65_15355 [Planctomycetaceae bacterium]|nr:hypothetical protein [Planctomycetaceae bacterium]
MKHILYFFVFTAVFTVFAQAVEFNKDTPIAELKTAAEKGDVPSQITLGIRYRYGINAIKDNIEAKKWFQKAAEKGNAEGQCRLAYCYLTGDGIIKDEIKAAQWFRKSAEQNYAEAKSGLGSCYLNGIGTIKDDIQAVKLFREASDAGDTEGRWRLGLCLYYGIGAIKDKERGLALVNDAARKGDKDASEVAARITLYEKRAANDSSCLLLTWSGRGWSIDLPNPKERTVIIVHGLGHSCFTDWVEQMARQIQNVEPRINIMAVDWSVPQDMVGKDGLSGAMNTAKLIPAVGQDIESQIHELGLSPDKIHIIGHSHGAHVSGQIGKRSKNAGHGTIDQITLLDCSTDEVHDGKSNDWDKNAAGFIDSYRTSKLFSTAYSDYADKNFDLSRDEDGFAFDMFFTAATLGVWGLKVYDDETRSHNAVLYWYISTMTKGEKNWGLLKVQ